jgi:hypothetical protein
MSDETTRDEPVSYVDQAAAEVSLPRGSGRTRAMLERALEQAGKAHTVWIIVANAGECQRLSKELVELVDGECKSDGGGTVTYQGTHFRFQSVWGLVKVEDPPGMLPETPRFVDHYAVEGVLGHLCKPRS